MSSRHLTAAFFGLTLAAVVAIGVATYGRVAAATIERDDEAREASRRMRTLRGDLIGVELEALRARQAEASRRSETMRQLILAFLSAGGACLFAILRVRKELERRRQAEHAVRAAHADAEDRIRARTAALVAANERIRSCEEQFRVIAEVSPVHVFAAASDGATTYVSPGFLALTGLPLGDALGFGWTTALHPDDREGVVTAWQSAIGSGQEFQSEFRFREAGGDYRWFKAHLVPVRGESGQVDRWVGAAADVHEQHEALAARAAALERERHAHAESERASRLKDDFLATISHELRTPLNAIVGWVHVLQTGILAPGDRQRAIEAIERNARAQARVVDDLLDVSRMIQGGLTLNVAPCDLRRVVDAVLETLEPAAAAKRLSIEVVGSADEVVVAGDEPRLKQVVRNLLSNAVKFTPAHGRITVEVSRVDDRARLRVADNGEGIDPAFLPHVFDPFRQGPSRSMRAGLGLGLAIVQEVVGLHGGSIAVESGGAGQGAVFTVALPAYDRRAQTPTASASREDLSGIRVLVAEDDADSAAALSAVLTHRGCLVRTVATARDVLATIGHWHPQVLVCDVHLPDGDAYSLLRRVRSMAEFVRVPAIAVAARDGDEDGLRAMAAGFRAHLTRPLDPEAIVREIGQASLSSPLG